MGRVTWILLALLICLATHIAWVLFYPSYAFERALAQNISDSEANTFQILKPSAQQALFPSYRGDGVLAVCAVELSGGKVKLIAYLPLGYWSLAIHTRSGAQVYSINDAEAASELIQVEMRQANSIVNQILEGSEGEEAVDIANAGWKVELPQSQGIASIWVPLSQPLARDEVEATLARSSCKRES